MLLLEALNLEQSLAYRAKIVEPRLSRRGGERSDGPQVSPPLCQRAPLGEQRERAGDAFELGSLDIEPFQCDVALAAVAPEFVEASGLGINRLVRRFGFAGSFVGRRPGLDGFVERLGVSFGREKSFCFRDQRSEHVMHLGPRHRRTEKALSDVALTEK